MKVRGQIVYSAEERIKRLSAPDPVSGCWRWSGTTRGGYGRLMIGSRINQTRKSVSAHRLSYETFVGAVPAGMEVCHKCDNRRCVNPQHLFVGSRQANIDDRENKGRGGQRHGEKNGNAKLTANDVEQIRSSFSPRRITRQMLAERFGVSESTIKDILIGRKWSTILPEPPHG